MGTTIADLVGWDRDAYAEKYWPRARGWAVTQWAPPAPGMNRDDIAAIGTDAIMDLVQEFPTWCAANNTIPTGGLFWTFTKQKIRWKVAHGMSNHRWMDSLDEPTGDESDETVGERTELVRQMGRSILHQQLADHIAMLPLRWKVYLALQFFEEFTKEQIIKIMDSSSVTHNIRPAVESVQAMAKHLVTDHAPKPEPVRLNPWEPPETLIRWVYDSYHIDVQSYIGAVQLHYAADVSYIIDILDRAAGHYKQPGLRVSDDDLDARLRGDVDLIRMMDPTPTSIDEMHSRTGLNQKRCFLAMQTYKRQRREAA